MIHTSMDSRYSDLRSISPRAVHTELQCSFLQHKIRKIFLVRRQRRTKKLYKNPPLRTNTPQSSSKISQQTISPFSKSIQAYQLLLFFCNSLSPASIWGNYGWGIRLPTNHTTEEKTTWMQAITDRSDRTERPRNLYLFVNITFISGVSFTWVLQPLADCGVTTRKDYAEGPNFHCSSSTCKVQNDRRGKSHHWGHKSPAPDAPATTGPQRSPYRDSNSKGCCGN